MKGKKHIKKNIRVGFIVKARVAEMKNKTSEGRIRRMIKEVVDCVQSVLGGNKLLV